jgi:hypothetical protein
VTNTLVYLSSLLMLMIKKFHDVDTWTSTGVSLILDQFWSAGQPDRGGALMTSWKVLGAAAAPGPGVKSGDSGIKTPC